MLTLLLLFPSCADFKMHVEGEAIQQSPALLSEPEHTMFLIGDAGDVSSDESASALVFLEQKLEEAPKNSSVVFLGDLVYPNGLPSRKSKGRQPSEQRINEQLDILQNFKGEVFFVPGNTRAKFFSYPATTIGIAAAKASNAWKTTSRIRLTGAMFSSQVTDAAVRKWWI
jgi:hypothetical protein